MLSLIKKIFIMKLLLLSLAEAAELRSYHETNRHLGMGGVRVAQSSDAMALAYNPAYLGNNQGLNIQVFDGGLGINGLQAYNSFSSVDWSGGISSFDGIYGKPLWLGSSGLAAISFGSFGLYYNRTYDLSVMLNDPIMPVLEATYFEDEFYHFGYGKKLNSGLAMGASIKKVIRTGGTTSVGTTSLADPVYTNDLQNNLLNSLSARGEGIGFDFGLSYQLPTLLQPTLSLAFLDVGGTQIRPYDLTNSIQTIRENIILTASFQQDLPLIGFAGGLEYRHIGRGDEPLGKKLHLGFEFQFLFFDLRAGLYQGYASYGLGTSFWLFQFDLVSFTKEMGVYPGQTPQERLMLALNMNLSFDPNFKLINSNGSKRMMKKRR